MSVRLDDFLLISAVSATVRKDHLDATPVLDGLLSLGRFDQRSLF